MNDDRRTFLKSTAAGAIAGGLLAQTSGAFAQDKGQVSAPKGQSNVPAPAPKNMSFTMLQGKDGLSLGVRTSKGIVDVGAAAEAFKVEAPGTTDEIIAGDYDPAALKSLIDKATAAGKYIVAESAAKFGPVVTSPSKIICVGLNYRDHANESQMKIPFEPILFNKYNSTLNGHNGTIAVSKEPGHQFDYETELVAVIGKEARNISEADALKHVFGYTVGHDFSERDQQLRDGQWMLGKTGDGWGPIGPWLVTADQINPDDLVLKTLVNGQERQNAHTRDMIFSTAKIVSFASKYFTLSPGDVIFTGTPSGVILGYPKDKQVWLKAGDKIVSSIDKIGELHFTLT